MTMGVPAARTGRMHPSQTAAANQDGIRDIVRRSERSMRLSWYVKGLQVQAETEPEANEVFALAGIEPVAVSGDGPPRVELPGTAAHYAGDTCHRPLRIA